MCRVTEPSAPIVPLAFSVYVSTPSISSIVKLNAEPSMTPLNVPNHGSGPSLVPSNTARVGEVGFHDVTVKPYVATIAGSGLTPKPTLNVPAGTQTPEPRSRPIRSSCT